MLWLPSKHAIKGFNQSLASERLMRLNVFNPFCKSNLEAIHIEVILIQTDKRL